MVKVRVRLGNAEAEVESDPENLVEAIELIPDIIGKLTGVQPSLGEGREESPRTEREGDRVSGPAELPAVSIEKSDSLADIIAKFFGDPWGRERRKLSDVREALQSYGLNYPKQSVAVALLRLAKTTKIRRFKAEDGEFVYTSATAFIPQPQPAIPEATLDAAT